MSTKSFSFILRFSNSFYKSYIDYIFNKKNRKILEIIFYDLKKNYKFFFLYINKLTKLREIKILLLILYLKKYCHSNIFKILILVNFIK
jgi:hypothetical protein